MALALAALLTALLAGAAIMLLRAAGVAHADTVAPRIVTAHVAPPDAIALRFSVLPGDLSPSNFRITPADAPDLPIPIVAVEPGEGGRVQVRVGASLSRQEGYRVSVRDPALDWEVRPSQWSVLLGIFLASALIQNFVFTRYLGLCIFFGVSKRRDTSLGMGVTFTAVMVLNGMVAWAIDTFVLRPLDLGFLQVLVFIGTVAFMVQFLDTMLRKTHASLHQRFGLYLMLITTNCIILAVPLLNAQAASGPLESFMLAIGSGLGFALALFLMSCARERAELARVPRPFQGLPIAFALAGLFALAFMGFSGLDFFR